VRPAWQAKNLIERVRKLLFVDPGSACQRLFNAAIHDLREKVIVAGLDIAKEAAVANKLPPVERQEDIEDYPTAKLIELSYRMGLLSRPEWRKMSRVYEIRRDLEHEDDEYEAGVEDAIYVFKTCVDVVLSRDPIQLLRVVEVKQVVEQPGPAVPDQALLADYEHAHPTRQLEIAKFLVSTVLDEEQPEVVRQNSLTFLRQTEPITQNSVKLDLAGHLQERLGRNAPDLLMMRIAHASGTLAYLKRAQREDFFNALFDRFRATGHTFRSHAQHGDLLRTLGEVGGLESIPPRVRPRFIEWLVRAYIGEPGGYGMGRNRRVFYSNSAAPLVGDLLLGAGPTIREDLKSCEQSKEVKDALRDQFVARRFQDLLDLMEGPVGDDEEDDGD
jgi:hypothetical protein